MHPYIAFRHTAREALDFYQSVFGGELAYSTFKDFDVVHDPGEDNKVMYGLLSTPSGFVLQCADTPNFLPYESGNKTSIAVSGTDEQELRGYWEQLVAKADIEVPLSAGPWGDIYGLCTDQFGVKWIFTVILPRR